MTKLSELEAILFIVGEEGIGLEEISYLLTITKEETVALLTELKTRYENDPASALHILETEAHVVLTTKKRVSAIVETLCPRDV